MAHVWSEDEKATLAAMWYSGFSYKLIGEKFGLSEKTIKWWVRKLEFPLRKTGRPSKDTTYDSELLKKNIKNALN